MIVVLLAVLLCGAPWAAAKGGKAKGGELPRLREVLKGVLYRSGTPSQAGLDLVCKNGWKRVYSLYGDRTTPHGPRNYAMALSGVDRHKCVLPDGGERVLEWQSARGRRMRDLPDIFQDVLDSVRDPAQGPVLVHCWNGLHYAGMVAAMALRQFCGLSADQAEAYWWTTTIHGENYPHVVRHIRGFHPLPGYSLSAEERERVCPNVPHPSRHRRVARLK